MCRVRGGRDGRQFAFSAGKQSRPLPSRPRDPHQAYISPLLSNLAGGQRLHLLFIKATFSLIRAAARSVGKRKEKRARAYLIFLSAQLRLLVRRQATFLLRRGVENELGSHPPQRFQLLLLNIFLFFLFFSLLRTCRTLPRLLTISHPSTFDLHAGPLVHAFPPPPSRLTSAALPRLVFAATSVKPAAAGGPDIRGVKCVVTVGF